MNLRYFVLTVFAFTFLGCSSSLKMLGKWSDDSFDPRKYENVGVVVLSPNVNAKAIVETDLATELRSKNIKATPTFDVFAFAGNDETLAEIYKGLSEEAIQEKIRERVNKFEMDALVIVTVLDSKKETRANGGGVSLGVAAPYSYNYAGYYSYAYTAISTPTYYTTTTTYFVESSVFDVATENLVWSGQSKVINPEELGKKSEQFAAMIVSEMLQ